MPQELTAEEIIKQHGLYLLPYGISEKISLAMKQYAEQERKKAFEAAKEIVVDENPSIPWNIFKYATYEDYEKEISLR